MIKQSFASKQRTPFLFSAAVMQHPCTKVYTNKMLCMKVYIYYYIATQNVTNQ